MAKTYSENLFSLSSGLLPAKVVIFICTINVYHTCPMHCRNLAEIMSEPKKLTGIQKPLDISTALAKIIGTKKGEQVQSASTCRVLATCPFHRFHDRKWWRSCGRTWRRRIFRWLLNLACSCITNSQDKENRQWFTPDKTMEPVFGKERQKCFGMSKHLKEHLTNPDKWRRNLGQMS